MGHLQVTPALGAFSAYLPSRAAPPHSPSLHCPNICPAPGAHCPSRWDTRSSRPGPCVFILRGTSNRGCQQREVDGAFVLPLLSTGPRNVRRRRGGAARRPTEGATSWQPWSFTVFVYVPIFSPMVHCLWLLLALVIFPHHSLFFPSPSQCSLCVLCPFHRT
ncbi:hypothetical protein E2C01_087016 [Portunus trituberculatus]|uniref:Uncharacterized protein n=1 Tax=Portunus trituberculatus TaxID=210409 RepID=A0A5B7J5E1_PORTR|nr:hypothetical protein [Portunus trituberculatus]